MDEFPGQFDFEQLTEQFERLCANQQWDAADKLLSDCRDDRLMCELLALDLEWKWKRGHSQPRIRNYLSHSKVFGCLQNLPTDFLVDLLVEEYRVRKIWGDSPTHDRFLAEYPDFIQTLPVQLTQVDRELRADGVLARRHEGRLEFSCEIDSRATESYADFVIQKHIGSGAMGRVYRARQISEERLVAIKALRKNWLSNQRAIESFVRESLLMMPLRHLGIVDVFGLGQFPNRGYFLVMDWIRGGDLQSHIDKFGPLPVEIATRYLRQLTEAVDYAHQHGIVHCDLKPANVLMARSDRIVLTDFGFAQRRDDSVTRKEHIVGGTLGFMAPEILNGSGAPDTWTDIYGLGAIFHTMLTGVPPGHAPIAQSGPGADLPGKYSKLLSDLLHPEPDRRPETAKIIEALYDS